MPNPRMSAATAKAKAAKMKAGAKLAASKNKKPAPTLKKGAPKTGKSKTSSSISKANLILNPNKDVFKTIKTDNAYSMPKFEKVSVSDKDLKLQKESPANMSGRSYDAKEAYNKNLTPKARLHYLENERHDAVAKKKGSPYHMGHKKSPMNAELVGNQKNLPEHLKKKIEAAPEMKGSPYHMSNELKYGGPVIDQMQTLSQVSASKVLRHMKK